MSDFLSSQPSEVVRRWCRAQSSRESFITVGVVIADDESVPSAERLATIVATDAYGTSLVVEFEGKPLRDIRIDTLADMAFLWRVENWQLCMSLQTVNPPHLLQALVLPYDNPGSVYHGN